MEELPSHVSQGQGDKGVAGGTGFLHYGADGKLVWAPGPIMLENPTIGKLFALLVVKSC